MKRIISFFTILLMSLTFTSCTGGTKIKLGIKNAFGAANIKSSNQYMVNILLYFSDVKGKYLIPEGRAAVIDKSIEQTIVEELIKGPRENQNVATLPQNIGVISISGQGNTLILNLSKEFRSILLKGGREEQFAVYSIVDSLTELPGVKSVIFKIEGKNPRIVGSYDFSNKFYRNRDILNRDKMSKPDEILKREMNYEKNGEWLKAYVLKSDDQNDPKRKYYNAYVDEMEDLKAKGFMNTNFIVDGYTLDNSGTKARVKVNFYTIGADGNKIMGRDLYFNCVKIQGAWLVSWLTKQ